MRKIWQKKKRMELYDITEESWKFQLNPTPEFEKALYQAQDSNEKHSFSWIDNSGELKVDAKNPYFPR